MLKDINLPKIDKSCKFEQVHMHPNQSRCHVQMFHLRKSLHHQHVFENYQGIPNDSKTWDSDITDNKMIWGVKCIFESPREQLKMRLRGYGSVVNAVSSLRNRKATKSLYSSRCALLFIERGDRDHTNKYPWIFISLSVSAWCSLLEDFYTVAKNLFAKCNYCSQTIMKKVLFGDVLQQG